MKKRNPLFLLILAMFLSIFSAACGSSDKRVAIAEKYLNALAERDSDEAKQYLCERRKHDADRIMLRVAGFNDGSEESEFSMGDIACQEDGRYVTCSYQLKALVFDEEIIQDVTETYRFESERICGAIPNGDVEEERQQVASPQPPETPDQ